MKFTVILLLSLVSHKVFAQSSNYDGTYGVRYDNVNSIIEYKLILKADGTFRFHSYTNHFMASPAEKNTYGKGTWIAKKNIITFFTDDQDGLNEKYTLNFNNTRARIDRKSIRNKSPEVIPDRMRVFESDIPWVKGMKLEKIGE